MSPEKIKILLVDDEPDILEFMVYNLKREGYQTFTAKNGQEAVDIAKIEHPNLIILDIMMPGMDGYAATAKIREYEALHNLPRTPIVALTANALPSDREKCLAVGMDDFLAKPFKAADIEAMLKRWSPSHD